MCKALARLAPAFHGGPREVNQLVATAGSKFRVDASVCQHIGLLDHALVLQGEAMDVSCLGIGYLVLCEGSGSP